MPISPILYLVSAAHFFNDIYMGFLTPLFPLVMGKFGLSLSQVGTISMIAALAGAVSQPFFGMLFDRFGMAASVYLAPLFTAILISALGIASSFPLFLVLLFLGNLGSAAFHPKGASVAPALSGRHPEIGMAVFSAGGNLGYAAGPAVFAVFVALWGMESTPVMAIPAALVAFVLFLLFPVREVEKKTRAASTMTWRALFADKAELTVLLRLVFINFAIQVGVKGMQTFLPVSMHGLGYSVTDIGIIFTIMLALGAAVSVYASSLSRTTGKRWLILGSVLVSTVVTLAGFSLMPSPAGIVLIVLGGMIMNSSNPILILSAQRHSGGSPAMASSLIMGISWGLAGLVMVPLGALGEIAGIKAAVAAGILFPLVAVVSCLRLPRE